MTCKGCKKLFSAYLDGYLDSEKRRSFEDHLAECEHCAAEFARLKKMVALTAGLPSIQPSPDFDRVLSARLADSRGITGFRLLFGRRTIGVFGTICLLLAVTSGVYVYKVRRGGHQGEDEHTQILVGREVVPMVRSYEAENTFTNFVMPILPTVKTSRASSQRVVPTASEDWQADRTLVLPFIMDERAARDEPETNYVIKRVSLIGASDEIGL